MRFFLNMHVWKKIACSGKIACCCLHVDMQFLMSTCDFFLNMQCFFEHTCLKKQSMFGKKSHVDIKNPNMHVREKLNVDIDNIDMHVQISSAC
jgi:hypothetical protein